MKILRKVMEILTSTKEGKGKDKISWFLLIVLHIYCHVNKSQYIQNMLNKCIKYCTYRWDKWWIYFFVRQ